MLIDKPLLMRKKIIATSWHPGGTNAILPVIKRLKENRDIEVITIAYQYSENILRKGGVDYKTIKDYGLSDVSVSSMEKILQQESPHLILTGTSSQDENNKDVIEQTIILAAKKKGIKSLAVLDFWGSYSLRFNDIYTGEKFKFLPDKIAIMDKYAEKDMLEEGFDKNRLVITGNPHFDSLESKARNFTAEQRKEIRKEIGMKNSLDTGILVFYAANAWKKSREELGYWDLDNIRLINEVLYDLPDTEKKHTSLVVKLHPRTPQQDQEEITDYITNHSKEKITLVTNIDPQELILATDLTLTSFSTLGIEAVYLRKPCISTQPGLKGEDYLAILTKNNIIPGGYKEEDCKALIKKAVTDKNFREKELLEQASGFRTDGKATERVTKLIYDMLS